MFSDILLENTHDEFDLSIAMTVYDSTIKYRVTGSIATVCFFPSVSQESSCEREHLFTFTKKLDHVRSSNQNQYIVP